MPASENIERLERVAKALGDKLPETAFVGGAVVELYVTDSAAPPVRSTNDVDCVVPVIERSSMQSWEEALRSRGFQHDTREGAPICRWICDETIVDVMPVDNRALGFTNPWYSEGLQNTIAYRLPSGTEIRIFDLPWFVATKMVAVRQRGGKDLRGSHDFEDIIYLWDNIPDFVQRLKAAPHQLKESLAQELSAWQKRPEWVEAVEGNMESGSRKRAHRILNEMKSWCGPHFRG